MNYLQKLEEDKKSTTTFFMDFLLRYKPKKKQVFAFYEGDEDSSFYHHLLSKVIDDGCELEEIVTGCKNNVIKLQKEFDWDTYNKKQIIFFVDRDLSYWLNDFTEYGENVFVTDEYSVENYVVNSQGFKAWLIHFEGFARANKSEVDNMVSEYERIIDKFKQASMPLMAGAVVAKKHDSSISLGDFKISVNKTLFFNTCNGHLDFKIDIGEKIFDKWKLTQEYDQEIQEQIEKFNENLDHYSVRGKWILCFMAEIGEYMRLNPDRFAPSLKATGKISPTCAVATAQCFSVLAPYCIDTIPVRLKKFLDETYQTYLQKN